MSSETMVQPKVLLALVKEANELTTDIAEQRGELGERIKHHKEHSNLHNKVFRVICALDRLAEDKRGDYIRHLNHQLRIMNTEKWKMGTHVGDLVDAAEGKAPTGETIDEFDAADPAKAAPANGGLSAEDATKAFEATKDKAGSGPNNGRKKNQDSVDQLRETLKTEKPAGSVVPMKTATPEKVAQRGSYKVSGA